MKFQLLDFVNVARAFGKVNFVVVAPNQMSANHVFWLTYYFKGILVKWGLRNAVIKLNDKCVVVTAAKFFGN